MEQADRADRANQAARTASGRCRLCLRMCRAEPAATTPTDRPGTHAGPSAAVHLKTPGKPQTELLPLQNIHKHRKNPRFKTISAHLHDKPPAKTHRSTQFQQAPRFFPEEPGGE